MAFTCHTHICTGLSTRAAVHATAKMYSRPSPASSIAILRDCCHGIVRTSVPQAFRSGPGPWQRSANRSRACRVKASSGSEESSQTAMSSQEAYDLLGVKEGASFDQIMSAKNKLVSKAGKDQSRKTQLEVAYDTLLMQAMQKRIKGEVAGQSVRFADVPKRRPPGQVATQAIQKLPGGLMVKQLPKDDSVKQAAAFAVLAGWALIQGLNEPPGAAQADVPGLQLALAVIVSLYVLRDKKRLDLVRAGGITAAGLIAGAVIGSALQSWLRVDIVPIGSFSSPGIFVGEFALVGLWAAAAFLA